MLEYNRAIERFKSGDYNIKNILQKRKSVVVGIALCLSIGLIFLRWGASTSAQQPRYRTEKVARGTLVSTVSASGQVLSSGSIPITTQASGLVAKVYVKNGDDVAAGQKIATITLDGAGQVKNAGLWSSYLTAKNAVDSALAAQYSLQSDMFTKWKTYTDIAQNSTYQNSDSTPNETNRVLTQFHVAQDDWLSAEAKYKNQQSVIFQAQAALSSAWLAYGQGSPDILAPASGKVSDIVLAEGMVISQSADSTGQKIGTIFTSAHPFISVNLPEVDVNKVHEADKATITVDAVPGKTYRGIVQGINKTGVVASGVTNFPAVISISENTDELLPNMSVTATITVAKKEDVFVVPAEAVTTRSDHSVVRVLRKGKPVETPVEIGISSDTQVEILSGLSVGDNIITGTVSSSQPRQSSAAQSPFGGFRIGGNPGGGAAGLRPGGRGR